MYDLHPILLLVQEAIVQTCVKALLEAIVQTCAIGT